MFTEDYSVTSYLSSLKDHLDIIHTRRLIKQPKIFLVLFVAKLSRINSVRTDVLFHMTLRENLFLVILMDVMPP